MLFPKTYPDIPKNWKKDLKFGVITPEKQKKEASQLKRTPIAKIGKKKKERLKNQGSEVEIFKFIWETTPHVCQECKKPIKDAFKDERLIKPYSFPHKLPKSMFPALRLLSQNIGLVCSIECHREFDKKWKDLELRRLFEQELLVILHTQQGNH